MYLCYFDEVKYNPPVQTSFWLGGIAVCDEHLAGVEEQVNALADLTFGKRTLEKGTEFHGHEIFQGKGAFKGVSPSERLEILKELLAICAEPDIVRFFVEIKPENLVTKQSFGEIAFMYLVEGVDNFLEQKGANGMLFGDFENRTIGTTVASLSRFREGGTQWAKGRKITQLLDTVHFAQSHHSRMIQLADVFIYARQFYRICYEKRSREAFNRGIRASGAMTCHFHKVWPHEKRLHSGKLTGWLPPSTKRPAAVVVELPAW